MPVDLYVGGAEHAVLHLLYARFWHKVLFDRGHVSTAEPFQRLVNQGMILSITYRTAEGRVVPYTQIRFDDGKAIHAETDEELDGEAEKMSKSRGNVIPVDVPLQQYGADTTRLYEMFMGPLEATKPWSMQGVEGISRFLNRAWRMIVDENADDAAAESRAYDPSDGRRDEQLRVLHKTIRAVTEDIEGLRFNTAISRLMEFVNFFTAQETRPAVLHGAFRALCSRPGAAHRRGTVAGSGPRGVAGLRAWPVFDERYTREDTIEVPIQINGRLRGHVTRTRVGREREIRDRRPCATQGSAGTPRGAVIRKVIVVPGKLVSIVISPK